MRGMKAVVLAAGRGSRLAPLTDDRPKPLVSVGGRPLLLRTIQRVTQLGIPDRDVVIVTGYREETVSALLRRESRGAHSRLDYAGMDAALGKVNMCVRKTSQGMTVETTPLPEMRAEVRAMFEPARESVR